MTPLTTLLLALPLLATAIDIATYNQAGSSRVPGYIGPPSTPLTGDRLTNTFCYCAPTTPGGNASHYYQTDYYNHHLYETFIIHHTCVSGRECRPCHEEPTLSVQSTCDFVHNRDCTDGVGWRDCRPVGATRELLVGTNQGRWENKWWRLSWGGFWHGRLHDHLIYHPNFQGKGRDIIEFNGHKRDLGPEGGQEPVFEKGEEAERVCGRVCGEQIGGGVLKGEGMGEGESRQVGYGGVDDMCNGCR